MPRKRLRIFYLPQVEPFLYNKGRGRYYPIANLVKLRNCDRPRHKQLPDIRILENPEEDFDIDADCPDVSFLMLLELLNVKLEMLAGQRS
jgi:hypothetical protein